MFLYWFGEIDCFLRHIHAHKLALSYSYWQGRLMVPGCFLGLCVFFFVLFITVDLYHNTVYTVTVNLYHNTVYTPNSLRQQQGGQGKTHIILHSGSKCVARVEPTFSYRWDANVKVYSCHKEINSCTLHRLSNSLILNIRNLQSSNNYLEEGG